MNVPELRGPAGDSVRLEGAIECGREREPHLDGRPTVEERLLEAGGEAVYVNAAGSEHGVAEEVVIENQAILRQGIVVVGKLRPTHHTAGRRQRHQ